MGKEKRAAGRELRSGVHIAPAIADKIPNAVVATFEAMLIEKSTPLLRLYIQKSLQEARYSFPVSRFSQKMWIKKIPCPGYTDMLIRDLILS